MRWHNLAFVLLSFVPSALAETTTVDVVLRDEGCSAGPQRFCIEPDVIQLAPEDDLVLRVTNRGRVAHNLTFAGGTPEPLRATGMKDTLAPNATITLSIPWKDVEEALDGEERGSFVVWCAVRGHEALGMRGELVVRLEDGDEERPQPFLPALVVIVMLAAGALALRRR